MSSFNEPQNNALQALALTRSGQQVGSQIQMAEVSKDGAASKDE